MNTQDLRRARLGERLRLATEPDREFVLTPCIGVCQMNAQTQWCEGCLRDIQEIARWGSFSSEEKRAIWSQIALRMDRI